MTPNFISVNKILSEKPIEVSAPCRVDSGGTWDIKAMSLPFENVEPVTVNIALTLRTRVSLSSYREGYIKITSEGFKYIGEYSIKRTDLPSKGIMCGNRTAIEAETGFEDSAVF